MNEELLMQVRRKLNITWSDDDTDLRVNDIMEAADPALKHRLGITDPNFNFAAPGIENTLFLAWCLYEFNHTLNEFEDNYASLLAQARAKHEVEFYLANEVTADA